MLEKVVHKWLRVPHILHVGNDINSRHAKVTVVFIHGLGNSHAMWRELIHKVSNEHIRVLTVDLLGFGNSPKPEWQTYSATVQAQSLKMTLRSLHINGPIILVGHSLGALVAVRYATMHPKSVCSLLLCSPPFYRPPKEVAGKILTIPQAEDIRRKVYSYSRNKTELAKKLAVLVKKARLLDESFRVDDETLPAIVSSLEMSIENQTSLKDAEKLEIPVHIVYGKLDPFIVKRNIRKLESKASNVTLQTLIAAHEIAGSKQYTGAVIKAARELTDTVLEDIK